MQPVPPDLNSVSRLVVIKMSALGDIAKAIPTVQAIRAANPRLQVGWVVRPGFADLLVGNPDVDKLFRAPKGLGETLRVVREVRRFGPEIVLDMQGLLVSGIIARLSGARWRCTWDSGRELSGLLTGNAIIPGPFTTNATENLFGFARTLGVSDWPAGPPAYLTRDPELAERAEELMAGAPEPRIGMHIGASSADKSWPPERWAELADLLLEAGYGVVLFGGKAEMPAGQEVIARMKHQAVSVVGKTPLRVLAAAASRCRLFVGADTGPTHIAALAGTPCIALMGPTIPSHTAPYGEQHQVITAGLACSPCFRHPTCNGRYDCMTSIDAARVFRACEQKLAEPVARTVLE